MSVRLMTLRAAFVAVLMVSIAAAGCGRSASTVAPAPSSPAPSPLTQAAADDIAQQLATGLVRDFGGGSGAIATSLRPSLRPGTLAATRAGTDSSSGSLSFRITVTYFDGQGQKQDAYDPETSVRMIVDRTVTGDLRTPQLQANVASHAVLDILGIGAAQDRLTLNGTGDDTLDSRFTARYVNAQRHLTMEANADIADVVQLKPTDQHPWPQSGVITYDVAADRFDISDAGTVEAHYEAHAKITFNGTEFPEIEFSEGWRYRVNLVTGQIDRIG